MEKYFNIVKKYTIKIFNFLNKLILTPLNKSLKKVGIRGFQKKPEKYIFNIVTLVLPILSFFLLSEFKYFTILLISFSTFLKYLNLCVFENLCLIKDNEDCKLNLNDLYESILIGFASLLILFLLRRFHDLLFRK